MGRGPSMRLGGSKLTRTKSVITQAAAGLAQRKYAPQNLKVILKIAKDNPVESQIASQAGMSVTALRYCVALSKSRLEDKTFDLPTDDGRVERFHILFEDACETGWLELENYARKAATGMLREVLTDRGRVQYKYDPELVGLGFTGEAAYLRDKNNDPVPETVPITDFEMTRFLLKARFPQRYGTRMQVEHEHKGGVLVVSAPMSSKQIEETFGGGQKLIDVEFEEVPDVADR